MSGAPRPVTWWRLRPQDLPIFLKKPDTSIQTTGSSGFIEVSRPRKILLNVVNFEGPPYDFLLSKMEELILQGALAGRLKAPGKFYGVLCPSATGLAYGLCFSPEDLIPAFQGHLLNIGLVYEIPPSECQSLGLPMWDDPDPPYTGPRPSRFEREWVL